MGQGDYLKGYQDGLNGESYDHPHPGISLANVIELGRSLTDEEKQDNEDYRRGYHEGKNDRE